MLKVMDLTKRFGSITAVDSLSFDVGKGEVFGLLGQNGAGKTTTLRILATMLKPTTGTAEVGGLDIIRDPAGVRSKIGILFGGESGLYDRLTAEENIRYFAELNGMDRKDLASRIHHLADVFGMEDFLNRRASKLSKGMKQKVAFARSIVHNPEIMLFDEPTAGLDVGAVRDVHDFIRQCRGQGKTIVFSSHSMGEVEKLCDRIGIIHEGKLVYKGTVKELKARHQSEDLEEIFILSTGRRKTDA